MVGISKKEEFSTFLYHRIQCHINSSSSPSAFECCLNFTCFGWFRILLKMHRLIISEELNKTFLEHFLDDGMHSNMYPCFQTAIKSLTDEESPPRYSLFKHDKRFAQFHSNSDSTSPTINHSQSPPSYGVHVIAQPAPVSTPLGKTYFINLIFLIFIISAHYSNIRRRFLF